jgi:hypothetical protein
MRNYRFPLARYGLSVQQLHRIALRLACRTGVARRVWVNARGRAYITFEGEGGYTDTYCPDDGVHHITGHSPTGEAIGLVEILPPGHKRLTAIGGIEHA